MISTTALDDLPDIAGFRRLTKSLAVLDAILSREWEDRYYSLDSTWSPSEMMASMRNGEGDNWMAIICDAGVALLGLAHEAPTYRHGKPQSWVFDGLPEAFHENARDEPAFDSANTTFCIWRLAGDERWSSGVSDPTDDGSEELLAILDGNPARYVEYARDYFEVELDVEDVRRVYAHEPLSEALVERLHPEVTMNSIADDLEQIAYPDSPGTGQATARPSWTAR